jgi:hypothetical protein
MMRHSKGTLSSTTKLEIISSQLGATFGIVGVLLFSGPLKCAALTPFNLQNTTPGALVIGGFSMGAIDPSAYLDPVVSIIAIRFGHTASTAFPLLCDVTVVGAAGRGGPFMAYANPSVHLLVATDASGHMFYIPFCASRNVLFFLPAMTVEEASDVHGFPSLAISESFRYAILKTANPESEASISANGSGYNGPARSPALLAKISKRFNYMEV